MLADNLKEREFQIEINDKKKELQRILAAQHQDLLAEQLRSYDEKEKIKKEKELKKKLMNQ